MEINVGSRCVLNSSRREFTWKQCCSYVSSCANLRSISSIVSTTRKSGSGRIASSYRTYNHRSCIIVPWGSRSFQTSSAFFSTSQFGYRVAASFSAKGHHFNPDTNLFNFDPTNPTQKVLATENQGRRKKKDRPDSGQDAFFISPVGSSGSVAFGVADGVGGWTESGIDPADFSHGLCEYMAISAYDFPAVSPKSGYLRPRELMEAGYAKVVKDRSIAGGGSTACVAVGRSDGSLEVANLGDSGFIQLRLNAVHHYSDPQTHAFNTPYQLSMIPPKILAQARIFGGAHLSDLPKDAMLSSHKLRHGDVLVFASDGVWDNLTSQDILKTVSRPMINSKAWEAGDNGIAIGAPLHTLTKSGGISKSEGNTLQGLLAVTIAHAAKMASLNSKLDGPFAREVQRFYPDEGYHGGKVDDICVVVAIVIEQGI
ncbi:MAG: hypothetical protein M1827_006921 [Pycnora praestabilis]|nr:MAG: hypothetical protein M1827_006921 [Pycnora praestabilis]